MKLNKIIQNVAIAALFMVVTPAMAQPGDNLDHSVDVLSSAELSLSNSFKINDEIQPMDSIIPVPPLGYNVLPKQMETDFQLEKITAAKLTVIEKLDKLYKGYVKAGVGNPLTALFDFYYNEGRSKNSGYAIRAKHFLSNALSVSDSFPSSYSDTKLGIGGHRFVDDHRLSGSLDWDRNVVHFYGLGIDSGDTSIADELLRQRVNHIQAKADIESYFKYINYNGGFEYHHFNDIFEASEHRVKLFGGGRGYLTTAEELIVDGMVDVNSFKKANVTKLFVDTGLVDNSESITSTIVTVKPKVISANNKYNVKLGLNIAADITDVGRFYFYPDIEARYSLFNDILIPYAGITGDVKRNSYQTTFAENPFVQPTLDLQNTRTLEAYGGFRGTFSDLTTFNARIGWSRNKNAMLFVNDTLMANENMFTPIYEPSMDIVNARAELAYQRNEKLRVHLRGDFYNYVLDQEDYAWHLPQYRVTLGGVYDLRDKIIIRGDVFVNGERYARVDPNTPGAVETDGTWALQLDPYVDINLGAEYRYTKRISVFANVNNLTANQYQRWNNFPVQRLTILGGLTVAF